MSDDDLDDDQLKADQRLVEFLARHSFSGPVWEEFVDELARYGIAVLTAWLSSGLIFVRCAGKGIRLPLPPPGWTAEDRLGLANEVVTRAINSFRRQLSDDRWCVDGGASLRTYFIGNCIYQFPRPYHRWLRSQTPRIEHSGELDEGLVEQAPGPEDLAIERDEVRRGLRDINSRVTRAVVFLNAEGYSHAEIARLIGGDTTSRSVEGVLYRYRRTQGGGSS